MSDCGRCWRGSPRCRWSLVWLRPTNGSPRNSRAQCNSPKQLDHHHSFEGINLPELVNILGVAVHAVHMESAVAAIEAAIESGTPGYVCVTGVHGVMESQNDEDLKLILNRAFLNVPDGMP